MGFVKALEIIKMTFNPNSNQSGLLPSQFCQRKTKNNAHPFQSSFYLWPKLVNFAFQKNTAEANAEKAYFASISSKWKIMDKT